MKTIFLLLIFISNIAHSNHQIDFTLTPDSQVLAKIMTPLWQSIPYEYELNDKTIYPILGDSITLQVDKGTIQLAQKPSPLFTLNLANDNHARFDWNFSQLKANIRAKLRFKFKRFGVEVTHDEYFVIKAHGLIDSNSLVKFSFQERFTLNLIKNEGFQFKQVEIKPENGIGSTLRFIFDNIFSQSQVDRYITNQINLELLKWINNQSLLRDLEVAINQEISELGEMDIYLSELANHLKIKFHAISFDENTLSFALKPEFITKGLKPHVCAEQMHKPYFKDNVDVDYNLIEKMINNFATFERYIDGVLQEPLFCFGYKEFDDNGEAIGEKAQISYLNRLIRFSYWATPTSAPQYGYDESNKMIQINLNLNLKLKGQYYPLLYSVGEGLDAKIQGKFRLEFDPLTGLNLKFDSFSLEQISGTVRVKWNRFTPAVAISMGLIKKQIEDMINEITQEEFGQINLFQPEIDFIGGTRLLIEDHQLSQQKHRVLFKIQ
jgi:hypothetical protein